MIFKGCLGNLDNELRPFPYRRKKNPSMLGGDVERLIIPVCTGSPGCWKALEVTF